jgi:hypothetical protein
MSPSKVIDNIDDLIIKCRLLDKESFYSWVEGCDMVTGEVVLFITEAVEEDSFVKAIEKFRLRCNGLG